MNKWLDNRVVEGKDVFIPTTILAFFIVITLVFPWVIGIWTIGGWLFGS